MTINVKCRRLIEGGLVDVPVLSLVEATPDLSMKGPFASSEIHSYNGYSLDFSAPGLYILRSIGFGGSPYFDGEYLISLPDTSTASVIELIRSLMFQTQYGRRDETILPEDALTQIRLRKLGMLCGNTHAKLVSPVLASKGIQVRPIHLLTAETPNNYIDGHVACEVLLDGKWSFFDVPNKICVRVGGEIKSIHDIVSQNLLSLNTVQMSPATAYPEVWSGTEFDTCTDFDQSLLFPADAAAWRSRIYQIPGIETPDGFVYFYMPPGTEDRQEYVTGLSSAYRVLSETDWLAKFYPTV